MSNRRRIKPAKSYTPGVPAGASASTVHVHGTPVQSAIEEVIGSLLYRMAHPPKDEVRARAAARQLRDVFNQNDADADGLAVADLAAAAAARVEKTTFDDIPEYPGIAALLYIVAEDLSIVWYPDLARSDLDVFTANVEDVCGPLGVTLFASCVNATRDLYNWGEHRRILDGWLDDHPSPDPDMVGADEWDEFAAQAGVGIVDVVTCYARIAALSRP